MFCYFISLANSKVLQKPHSQGLFSPDWHMVLRCKEKGGGNQHQFSYYQLYEFGVSIALYLYISMFHVIIPRVMLSYAKTYMFCIIY